MSTLEIKVCLITEFHKYLHYVNIRGDGILLNVHD